MSPAKLIKSSHNSPAKSEKSPDNSASVVLSTNSLLSSTKKDEFEIMPSTVVENHQSLDAYISHAEFETTCDNSRMLT